MNSGKRTNSDSFINAGPNAWGDVWSVCSLLVLSIALAVGAATFLDYGITYDEEWHRNYGVYIVDWYASGFENARALTYWTLPLQGGFFDVVSVLASYVLPFGSFQTNHLVSASFGLFALAGTLLLARHLGGPLAGFLALAFLALTPRFYGHAFANPVDIPMAALTVLSVYYIVRCLDALPFPPMRLLVALGVFIGLALAVRVPALILLVYLAFSLVLFYVAQNLALHLGITGGSSHQTKSPLPLVRTMLVVCVVAYPVMLLWWPAAIVEVKQPAKALWYATHFQYPIKVLFEGEIISNQNLPWHYLLKWFVLVTPEHYFVAFSIGACSASFHIWKRFPTNWQHLREWLRIIVVSAAASAPIVYSALFGIVDYDGIRHFLFVLPLMAVLAAISITSAFRLLQSLRARIAIPCLVAVPLIVTLVDMVRLHPYQYVYFNRLFAGGLSGAHGRYDLDYWGSSYKEGVRLMVDHYEDHDKPIRVASASYSLSTSYYLPEGFDYVGSIHDGNVVQASSPRPDVFLATPRWNAHQSVTGETIAKVERMGVPLLYVIAVSPESEWPPKKITQTPR